ncbi:MAG: dephospho-CoA kinase [Endomicrobia bacterium]|nr:dephospho-CoA kinase [Endomicrobiia bacterium]
MKIIGLTGNIAVGKTTALGIFSKYGVPVISCDEIYHNLLETNSTLKSKLVEAFGRKILLNNKVCRKKLYKIILEDVKNLYLLEKITHPIILKEVFKKIEKLKHNKKYKLCVVDVPLLFEKKLQNKFDYIIIVYSSKNIQVERLKKRNVNRKLLNLLNSRQIGIKKKFLLSDFIIYNDGINKRELEMQIVRLLRFLIS